MSAVNLERYEAKRAWTGTRHWRVVDTASDAVIAHCSTEAQAKQVASALNDRKSLIETCDRLRERLDAIFESRMRCIELANQIIEHSSDGASTP